MSEACPSMRDIIDFAATMFEVTREEIVSPRHEARLTRARHIAMYACRVLTPRSFPEIGRAFGGRDHSTVRSACLKIEASLDDPETRQLVETFFAVCRAAPALSAPDVDPYEQAARILARPGLATNVSLVTIQNFAAIVSAAIHDAKRTEHELAQYRVLFASLLPALTAFAHAFAALDTASPRGEGPALRRFERAAADLAAAIHRHLPTSERTSA